MDDCYVDALCRRVEAARNDPDRPITKREFDELNRRLNQIEARLGRNRVVRVEEQSDVAEMINAIVRENIRHSFRGRISTKRFR